MTIIAPCRNLPQILALDRVDLIYFRRFRFQIFVGSRESGALHNNDFGTVRSSQSSRPHPKTIRLSLSIQTMSIVSHVSVGSTAENMSRMLSFYDSVLSEVGAKRKMAIHKKGEEVQQLSGGGTDNNSDNDDDLVAVAYGKYYPEFWVQLPENQKETASPGNGVHIAFSCTSAKQVDRVYKAALDAGGIDNGPPGPRPQYSDRYYGAFFIDPCGNKLEATFYNMGLFNYCAIS